MQYLHVPFHLACICSWLSWYLKSICVEFPAKFSCTVENSSTVYRTSLLHNGQHCTATLCECVFGGRGGCLSLANVKFLMHFLTCYAFKLLQSIVVTN